MLCLSDLCHSSEWSVVLSLYGNKETLVWEARSGMFPCGTLFKGQLESDSDTRHSDLRWSPRCLPRWMATGSSGKQTALSGSSVDLDPTCFTL